MQHSKKFIAGCADLNYKFLPAGSNLLEKENASFLKEKIIKIGTALCCIEDESFAIRTHIVHVIDNDESGNLYFMLMHPINLYGKDDLKSFPLSLTFYKKSYDYYIQLKALAAIGDDDYIANGYVLVHAKILEAEYTEHEAPFIKGGIFNVIKKTMSSLSKSLAMFFY